MALDRVVLLREVSSLRGSQRMHDLESTRGAAEGMAFENPYRPVDNSSRTRCCISEKVTRS